MIDTSIYKLIFIFSTEYFTSKIIDSCKHEKKLLKDICMHYTNLIVDNEDNYYLNTNFSSENISAIETNFFKDIRLSLRPCEIAILDLSLKSLKINHQNLLERRKKSAIYESVNNLTEEFYLYYIDKKNPETLCFDVYDIESLINENYLKVCENSWSNSEDKSDKFVTKIMGETPDAVFYYYLDMIEIPFFKLYPYMLITDDIQKKIEFYESISNLIPKDRFYNSEDFIKSLLFGNLNNNIEIVT